MDTAKHEGVRYACNQCDKKFTKQVGLTRHFKSEHEGVKYACIHCEKQYSQKTHLATHIKNKHEP